MTNPARRRVHDANSLLDVAVRVFNERGYDGTSMEHIAAAAGITKSSIYHHVASKEALLGTALQRAAAALNAALPTDQLRPGERAIDTVERVIRQTTTALLHDIDVITLFLRVRGNSPTEQWALQQRREFDRRVSDLVRQAAVDGDIRAELDPAVLTRLIFGAINSLIDWYKPGALAADQVADQVCALALSGIRTPQLPYLPKSVPPRKCSHV